MRQIGEDKNTRINKIQSTQSTQPHLPVVDIRADFQFGSHHCDWSVKKIPTTKRDSFFCMCKSIFC